MFTAEQIREAHGKVKSGADFPSYIREIKAIGVKRYESYVSDGHIDYHGVGGYTVSVPAKYETMHVADNSDPDRFQSGLKAHQQGKTDYPTFCRDCASAGVEKWMVDLEQMICTYYDTSGNQLLTERIPE